MDYRDLALMGLGFILEIAQDPASRFHALGRR